MATEVSATSVSEELLREACAELDRRLRALEPVGVEEMLERLPGLSADSIVELIYTEFVVREELGRQLKPADWFARFPQWRERLGRLMQVHQALHHAENPDTATAVGAFDDTGFSVTEKAAERGVPGYEILEESGRGGMGVVYKARQVKLNRIVALKMILTGDLSGPEERARFHEEAQAAARLQHPNIVQVFEAGVSGGCPFLALEFVAGNSLAQVLINGPVEAHAAAQLVATLARASHYAHGRGVIHRDLKPGNILLQKSEVRSQKSEVRNQKSEGDDPAQSSGLCLLTTDLCPKIIDFGLAKQRRDAAAGEKFGGITRTGMVLGTPSYMAPEQASGDSTNPGPTVDIYALGTILYEALTGRPPFRAATPLETLEQVRTQEPVSPARLQPGLPRDLETICLKCLEKDPGRRYPTAQELADDLERFLRGESIRARPTTRWERGVKWARRRPTVAGLLAALTLLALSAFAAVTVLWRQAEHARRQTEAHLARRSTALARAAWMTDDYDLARQSLLECPSALRDAEWDYLDRVCHAEQFVLRGHKWNINAVAYSRDGRLVASVTVTKEVKLWNAASAELVRSITPNDIVPESVAFAPDGHQLFVVGRTGAEQDKSTVSAIKTIDVRSGDMRFAWKYSSLAQAIKLSPDCRNVVLTDRAMHQIKLIDLLNGSELQTIPDAPRGHAGQHAFSPDGKSIASAVFSNSVVASEVVVWDAASGRKISAFRRVPGTSPCGLAFSEDGKRIVTGSNYVERESDIAIHDVANGLEQLRIPARANATNHVAFSPDGRYVASAAFGNCTVTIWDAVSGGQVLTFRSRARGVMGLAFRPDGRQLATGNHDWTVRLWDTGYLSAAHD
jgi:serine/threonine protein kinase/DNA-binding beta-propeller fold protein YncE